MGSEDRNGNLLPERQATPEEGRGPGLGGVVLTGDFHRAIEAAAAVLALEVFGITYLALELVFPTATFSVLVCSARR